MDTRKQHWNGIFAAKLDAELGWYEPEVSQSLKFLDAIPLDSSATIFLPGAGTSLLVDALFACGHTLILNDISDEALKKLKDRLGTDSRLIWLQQDISQALPADLPPVDLWLDRAVLHFLLSEEEMQGYFANLCRAVSPGGYVLLAEFSAQGAPKCAGLEVHRYSLQELTTRLGEQFHLLNHEDYTYVMLIPNIKFNYPLQSQVSSSRLLMYTKHRNSGLQFVRILCL